MTSHLIPQQVERRPIMSTPDAQRAEMVAQLDHAMAELVRIIDGPPLPAYSAGRIMVRELADGRRLPVEDHSERMAAMDRLAKLQQRKAALLGLDAPTAAVITHQPAPATLASRVATLRGLLQLAERRGQDVTADPWAVLVWEVDALESGDVALADQLHGQYEAMARRPVRAPIPGTVVARRELEG